MSENTAAGRRASLWEMILGNANEGCMICFYMLTMYASYVGNQGYGIAVATVGAVLAVLRIFNGTADAVMASFFERFPAKHGKIRIMLLIGWSIAAFGVLLLYHWAAGRFQGFAGMVVFVLGYVIYIIGYSINDVAGSTVSVVITTDPVQRPMNGMISTMYAYLAPMVFQTVISFLILPRYDNQYNLPMLKESCYLYVGVALVFVLLACIGLRRVDVESTFVRGKMKERDKITMKEMFAVLRDNRESRVYIIIVAVDKFTQQTAAQSVTTTMMSGILIGSYTVATMIGNFTMIIGIAFAILGSMFVAKFGAKKSVTTWAAVSLVIAGLTVVFCRYLGPEGMKQIGSWGMPMIVYAVLQLAAMAGKMMITSTSMTMRADVVDYELYRSGNYLPAIVGGIGAFADKIMSSLSMVMATASVALIGYRTHMPQKGDPATEGVFWMTMFLMFGLPMLGWICDLISMRFYQLDRERMMEIQRENQEREELSLLR